jgi:hypothetical protein
MRFINDKLIVLCIVICNLPSDVRAVGTDSTYKPPERREENEGGKKRVDIDFFIADKSNDKHKTSSRSSL